MNKGYQILKVKDICQKASSNLTLKDLDGHDGKFPIFGASGFVKNVDFYHRETEYLGLVKDGSGIGRVMFLPPQSSVIGTLQYILPKNGFDIRYVGYCLQSIGLDTFRQGAAIPHIYFKDYGETDVFVSIDKDEQQRIVEKLDNAFAKIDAIKVNAEKNLKEAELLFHSVLAEEIDNRGATILPLEKIVDSQSYISYGIVQPGDDQVNGVSIVRPIDLRFKTLTSIEGFKKTKQSISDAYKRSVLDGREILMCVRGTTGIVSMSSPALKGCNVTRGIVPLRIKDDIKRNYVYYALLAPCCQKYINEHTNGTALKQINIADVKTIPIAIPDSLSLQQLLVNKLNFIEERCIKLRSVCQNIAKECDALKQTILRKAFSGEL